jgi:cytochrome c-type biogenesis protein CcmE
VGPVVVNYMREYQLGLGIPREQVYNQTMYILACFLVVGLICNLLVRPLNPKWFMTPAELEAEKRLAHEKVKASEIQADGSHLNEKPSSPVVLVLAWAAVGIPLAWGVYRTLQTVAKFF